MRTERSALATGPQCRTQEMRGIAKSCGISESAPSRVIKMASAREILRRLEPRGRVPKDVGQREIALEYSPELREAIEEELAASSALYRATQSFVYFVESVGGNAIKIGFTKNLGERIAALQKYSTLPLQYAAHVFGGYPEEQALHERFAHLRMHGEWFRATDELVEYVLGLESDPEPDLRGLTQACVAATKRTNLLADRAITEAIGAGK